jgi:Uma2 family endonuclease
MAATATQLITAEEFMRMPNPEDGSRQELVRGKVITMPSPFWNHGKIAGNIYFQIRTYLRENPIGQVVVEGGVITQRDPDTVRGPDVSFMSNKRLPPGQTIEGYAEGAPDLCVEVLSKANTPAKIDKKLVEYFGGGSKLVWIVDPKGKTVRVHRSPKRSRLVKVDETLDGGDVLPGFTCAVADFFS